MDKTHVAQGVANQLWTAENAVDAAMVEASKLMTDLMQARQELRLSAVVADPAYAKIAEAISALSTARTAMVDAHNELAEAKLRVGIRTKLIGIWGKDADQALYTPEMTRAV